MNTPNFIDKWRREKSKAFDLEQNSTAGKAIELNFWGKRLDVYANANLSIYTAQQCNARCPFCVEELRPASRGNELISQKKIESDDKIYFAALEEVLSATKALNPSVSITGGEASKDPRLPKILSILQAKGARKRTITTNGSGLLDVREGKSIIEWIIDTGVQHLNISIAHYDLIKNARIMRYQEGLSRDQLSKVVEIASQNGCRVRLSCLLLEDEVDSYNQVIEYLNFASSLGVDNVIFRQLMKTDPRTSAANFVVLYSDQKRVKLEAILDQISASSDFSFIRQIMGYYYYVEVWRYGKIDVVFEEADLAQLEDVKKRQQAIIHELIFHPSAQLCSTWQPWDGILGPHT